MDGNAPDVELYYHLLATVGSAHGSVPSLQWRKNPKGYVDKCLLSKVTILQLQYKDKGWGDLIKYMFNTCLTFIISKFLKKKIKSKQHVNRHAKTE